MIGYSPQFPLKIDSELGAYAVTKTLKQVAKQNFMNLMLTSPGERIMDKRFGVGLRNYLFEPATSSLAFDIGNRIRSQVERYLSFIEINEVLFNTADVGMTQSPEQVLSIHVEFSIPALAMTESILISSNIV